MWQEAGRHHALNRNASDARENGHRIGGRSLDAVVGAAASAKEIEMRTGQMILKKEHGNGSGYIVLPLIEVGPPEPTWSRRSGRRDVRQLSTGRDTEVCRMRLAEQGIEVGEQRLHEVRAAEVARSLEFVGDAGTDE